MSVYNGPPKSTLIVEDVLLDTNSRVKIPLTFHKVAPLPEDLIKPHEFDVKGEKDLRVTERRLRDLSALTNLAGIDFPPSFSMKLGDCLGIGRSSHVFEVKPSGLPSNNSFPPLVAKFCAPGFSKFILREAWFYEEMQTLQGEVIPWCFGLFFARIPRGNVVFIPWLRGETRDLWTANDAVLEAFVSQEEQMSQFIENCAQVKSADDINREQSTLNYLGEFKEEYAELVKQFEDSGLEADNSDTIPLPVLILERVGKPYLPKGGKNWPQFKPIPEDITKDVFDAYDRLFELRISHMDIKYENILAAIQPIDPDSQHDRVKDHTHPDSTSSVHHHPLKCRIIDFEMSKKTNLGFERLKFFESSYIRRLIKNLPDGVAMGQNYSE